MDETYLGSKLGNLKNKRKKEADAVQFRPAMWGKTTIFGILERGGKVYTKVIAAPTKEIVEPLIKSKVAPTAIINSDTSNIYTHLKSEYSHGTVNHQKREWVRGDWHVQNIESFWNQVKRTIKGTHIHVSLKHIQKYLDEVAFRWEHRYKQDEMFDIILSNVA